MSTGQEAQYFMQEKRTTMDGVEVAQKTVMGATDEGSMRCTESTITQPAYLNLPGSVVTTEVRTVETITSGPIIQQPAVFPVPTAPVPLVQQALPAPVVMPPEERTWVDICFKCDSDEQFYSLKGKGICWILLLLLCYLVAGTIVVAFAVVWIVCKCIACLTEKEEEEVYVVRRRRNSCAIS